MAARKKSVPVPAPAASPSQVAALFARLQCAIPTPQCELDHASPWQLLVATILSAQSTDKTINSVTPALFARWPDAAALAAAPREEVEQAVHRTGFFRNKAKSIQLASLAIAQQHGGKVPKSMAALLELPGVARKTANLVLGTGFGIPAGIVVDTHVTRVAQVLGLSTATKPEAIEADLCALLPKDRWVDDGHRLLLHGRYVCTARQPDCAACPLHELCPSAAAVPVHGTWEQRAGAEARTVAARGTA